MIVMAIATGDLQSGGGEGCADGVEDGELTMALQGGLSMPLIDTVRKYYLLGWSNGRPSDKACLKAACSQHSPIVSGSHHFPYSHQTLVDQYPGNCIATRRQLKPRPAHILRAMHAKLQNMPPH